MQALIPANVQAAQPTLVDGLGAMLSKPRDAQIQAVENAIGVLLENVASLDEDRILRSFVGLIRATLRPSFFQPWEGACRDSIRARTSVVSGQRVYVRVDPGGSRLI